MSNTLFYGDNLEVMRDKIKDESVDLCYIDPPFNSNRDYFQIYNNIGGEDRAQAQAFTDTWTWDTHAIAGLNDIFFSSKGSYPAQTIELLRGLKAVLGEGALMAYLVSMTQRINEIHRVLKPTGSFYLHCDPTASHYLKLVLDTIFVTQGGDFRNEIIWRRTGSHGKVKRFGPIHDVIFYYVKSAKKFTWNKPKRAFMVGHVKENFVQMPDGRYKTNYYGNVLTGSGLRNGESGSTWMGFNPSAKNRHWAIPGSIVEDCGEDFTGMTQHQKLDRLLELGYIKIVEGQAWPIYERVITANDGQSTGDIWAFQPYTEGTVFGSQEGIDEEVRWLSPHAQERLKYPTQKPEGLLERIIAASSNEGDVVLDAYCGCGTTIAVAQRLKRQWIGIDITYQSIGVILKRLLETYGEAVGQETVLSGIPKDIAAAKALALKKDDRVRKEFEKWAVLTYSRHQAIINAKKGADAGIDGVQYFPSGAGSDEVGKVVFQVKSGKVERGDIAKLRGDMARENAKMAVFLTLETPTAPMKSEALAAGMWNYPLMARDYPQIQIVTVEEMLRGAKLDLPLVHQSLKKSSAKFANEQTALDLSIE